MFGITSWPFGTIQRACNRFIFATKMSSEGKSTSEEQTKLVVTMDSEETQPTGDPPNTPDELNTPEDETHASSDTTPILDAIRCLYRNGMRFQKAPSSVWGLE